jgi:prophage regulatory protein
MSPPDFILERQVSERSPLVYQLPSLGYVREAHLVRDPKHPDRPHLLPVSRSTLRRWVRAGRFPRPCRLSPGVTAWSVAGILEWQETQRRGV